MPRARRCRYPNCHGIAMLPDHYCARHIEHEAEYLAKREQWHARRSAIKTKHYNDTARQATEQKAEQNAYYHSREWKQLREFVLQRDSYIDQYAKLVGIIQPGKLVDHIVPIEFDSSLRDDPDNLITTSYQFHYKKTKWEQDYYGTGANNKLKCVSPIRNVYDLPFLRK
ncbi:hypothetical protein [Lactobacillus selangorensis]|uniref:hypothetical protein n=1 Tax=Lactobacillus selangorensis TaxID=81857 RepID=UPI00070C093F|nr:hypothetical protein [Lactobacillus selangorensis]